MSKKSAISKSPILGYFTMAGGGAPAATPWYLAGGVSATNCIEVHQPIGAASYAESLTDLSGNSNSAQEGVAPDWDATNGWKFNGSSHYLLTAISAVGTNTYSYIVRFSNVTSGGVVIALRTSSGYRCDMRCDSSSKRQYSNSSKTLSSVGTNVTSGVMAMAGSKAYYNGSDESLTLGSGGTTTLQQVGIGARNDPYSGVGSVDQYTAIYIQAMAIYNTALTPDQVAAITTAMAAL